jgi:hypothetical protein
MKPKKGEDSHNWGRSCSVGKEEKLFHIHTRVIFLSQTPQSLTAIGLKNPLQLDQYTADGQIQIQHVAATWDFYASSESLQHRLNDIRKQKRECEQNLL